jgi:uncharacterized protein with HEPN domain
MLPSEALNLHRDRIRYELADMVEAIERIQRYKKDMTLDDFLADSKTRDAVLRNVGVLGRLAERIERHETDDMAWHSDVPLASLSVVRRIANRPYHEVDETSLWHAIHDDLPALHREAKGNPVAAQFASTPLSERLTR